VLWRQLVVVEVAVSDRVGNSFSSLSGFTAGSKIHPPMLNKENYVPWSSRHLRYAKSIPNGKLIHNSIINGPYVRRMIPEPGDTNWDVPVNETIHIQIDDELTEKELKQIEADNQAIQSILLGLSEECSSDYTQLYDFLKYNQKDVDELKVERLAKTQDPLALMATSNNPYNFPVLNQDQPSFNQNYMQQPMLNPEDITDPTTAMNMALALMAKAFKPNYSTPTNNNQRISSNPCNRQIAQLGMNMGQDRQMRMVGGNGENQFRQYARQNVGNLNGYNAVQNVRNQVAQNPRVQNVGNQNGLIGVPGNANHNGNDNLVVARAEGNAAGHNGNQIRCYNCRGVDLDEFEEVNANCILMANLQQASTSGTQTDKAPIYDSDGSAEHKTLELEIVCLLRAVVSQDIISVVQKTSVVDTSNLQTELERTKERFENCIIKKENEYAKLWNDCEFESQSDCSKGDNAYTSNHVEPTIKRFPNATFSSAGFGYLQWRNILITRVYFVEGLGHNLFSVRQFCDSDLEVAFRRNACFIRNLEGVDLLKGDRSTNLYTINLHEIAFASPFCLMARASSTKSLLWHQRLSHLNFDTINDLARNDLASGLPKFKYHKEHLCPSCEQGKSKRASHPPKPVPNSRQMLHLLHMDLCGPIRITSINGKRITVLLQSLVIIIRTENGTEFKNQVLKEYFDTVGISHQMFSVRTPQQNRVVERRNRTKPDISFLQVFGALCYPKNDREDIGKLGTKGDIGFFIGYSADSCACRIYNQRTKKIMETMNVSFDELLEMAFKQRSSKPRLQSMTSGQISSGLDLTYAPSTITTQQPSEGELDLLFEAMYDDYIGGQPLADSRSVPAAQAQQVRQTSTSSTSIADTAPMPTNLSSQATNFPSTSQDVDELNSQQQHAHQQGNQVHLQSETVANNVSNAMFDANTFVSPFANPSTSTAESSSS
nr:retrovirus-related Pol polyprotein from transposon TNT 1-94 [Tanacetum cinerariifolium]